MYASVNWVIIDSVPSHYLNQCWLIVNWTPGNKFKRSFNQNSIISIQEYSFENVVCQIGSHFVQGEMSLKDRQCMYSKQSTTRWRAYSMRHVTPLVPYMLIRFITLTSCWARWRLKSPASRLFALLFVRAQIKEKNQSSTSLAFVRGIHRWPMDSPHKGPVTLKCFHLMTSSCV